MNNFNYGPYSQNPYSKYQNNYNNQNLANKNPKDFNYYQMKRNRIYNIYNSNINSINININTINLPNKNNKTPSLQDEILSPNIEDYRPRPPSSNYYDDYNYYSKRNLNYNLRLYQNDPKIRQRERF